MLNSKAGLGDVVEKAEERRAQSTSRNVGQDRAFATFAKFSHDNANDWLFCKRRCDVHLLCHPGIPLFNLI